MILSNLQNETGLFLFDRQRKKAAIGFASHAPKHYAKGNKRECEKKQSRLPVNVLIRIPHNVNARHPCKTGIFAIADTARECRKTGVSVIRDFYRILELAPAKEEVR